MSLERPSLRELASVFFRIGNSTFGSGSTSVVLLQREIAERGWLENAHLDMLFAVARIIPGTNVLAFVTSAGHALRGIPGAATALLSLSAPASCITIALILLFQRYGTTPGGNAFFTGAMSGIVGIILAGCWLLAAPRIRRGTVLRTLTLVVGSAALAPYLQPLAILLLAGVVGAFWRVDP